MHPFKVILWDIDGTLLDFHKAESAAIHTLFRKFGLGECTDEMLASYKAINITYWQKLERGELTKPQVLIGRFHDFFKKYDLDISCAPAFNEAYQLALGDTVHYFDGALETVQAMQGKILQCAVTNGTAVAQHKKLAVSGLDKLLDHFFISDEIGIEKPNIGFFDAVWAKLGSYDPADVLIVGDSLTSDIKGGNNAGIRTCWFNPNGAPLPQDLRIDYDIRQIPEVLKICELA